MAQRLRWLRQLGPGIVTGAANDDPAAIGTFSQVGAQFGYGTLWLNLYTLPFMGAVLEMCAQIGNVAGQGLATTLRHHYPAWVRFGVLALLIGANTINLAADLAVMADAVRLLLPGPRLPWLAAIAVLSAVVQAYLPYDRYARVLKGAALVLLVYVVTAVIVTTDWGGVLRATALPALSLDAAFLAGVIAIVGTRLSPYVLLWQPSQVVEEKVTAGATSLRQRREEAHRDIRRFQVDVIAGSLVANLVTWAITITAAAALHAHGITSVGTAAQAADALRPVAGGAAALLFAIGILATGLLAVPVLSAGLAYGLSETFGWARGLRNRPRHAKAFYGVMAGVLAVAVAINLAGIEPLRALYLSQVLNGVTAIPLVFLILRICNDRAIMGERVNGPLANVLGWTALVLIAGVAAMAVVARVLES